MFAFLEYLTGITRNVALGAAAVVLPPLMAATAAASIDVIAGEPLILGVARGDRPIEYPVRGIDFDSREKAYRKAVDYLRTALRAAVKERRVPSLDLLP